MRTLTIVKIDSEAQRAAALTFEEALKAAPWAAEVVVVDGGWKAFESMTDYEQWLRQS